MIDVIEWTTTLEHTLELSKLANITTRVEWHFDVSAQTETDLVRLVLKIARNNVMPAVAQLVDQARTDRSQPACYENAHLLAFLYMSMICGRSVRWSRRWSAMHLFSSAARSTSSSSINGR